MTTIPLSALLLVPSLLLSLRVPSCVAVVVPLSPFGDAAGDMFVNDTFNSGGNDLLPLPMYIPFPGFTPSGDPSELAYEVAYNGLYFVADGYYGVTIDYSAGVTPATYDGIGVGGGHYRLVNSSASDLSLLWSDVLAGGLVFTPEYAVVVTFYKISNYNNASSTITVQFTILWNADDFVILFRLHDISAYIDSFEIGLQNFDIIYQLYVDATLMTSSNVKVPGLYVYPPEMVGTTPTRVPTPTPPTSSSPSTSKTPSTLSSPSTSKTPSTSSSQSQGTWSPTVSKSGSMSSVTQSPIRTASRTTEVSFTAITVSVSQSASGAASPSVSKTHSFSLSRSSTATWSFSRSEVTLSRTQSHSTSKSSGSHTQSHSQSESLLVTPTKGGYRRSKTPTKSLAHTPSWPVSISVATWSWTLSKSTSRSSVTLSQSNSTSRTQQLTVSIAATKSASLASPSLSAPSHSASRSLSTHTTTSSQSLSRSPNLTATASLTAPTRSGSLTSATRSSTAEAVSLPAKSAWVTIVAATVPSVVGGSIAAVMIVKALMARNAAHAAAHLAAVGAQHAPV